MWVRPSGSSHRPGTPTRRRANSPQWDLPLCQRQRTNLDQLEEVVSLQAELMDLRGDAAGPAEGIVIESRVEKGRGYGCQMFGPQSFALAPDRVCNGAATGMSPRCLCSAVRSVWAR